MNIGRKARAIYEKEMKETMSSFSCMDVGMSCGFGATAKPKTNL